MADKQSAKARQRKTGVPVVPRVAGPPTSCQKGVDALGWEAGAVYSCHGVRVGLRGSTVDGLAALVSWLPRAMTSARSPIVPALYSYVVGGSDADSKVKRFHILYRNFTRLARSLDVSEIQSAFCTDLSMYIAEHASRRVFVHAGVVAVGDAAILIPGKSFSGKTTLTRALVEQGGVYYSDEYAVLDSRGRVSPWAEPLSIRRPGPKRPGKPHSAASLGLRAGRRPVPVRLVVMTSFEEGKRFRPRQETAGAGTLGLLEHTLPARHRPRAVLRTLASALTGARVLSGARGEAHTAAQAILRYLSERRAA